MIVSEILVQEFHTTFINDLHYSWGKLISSKLLKKKEPQWCRSFVKVVWDWMKNSWVQKEVFSYLIGAHKNFLCIFDTSCRVFLLKIKQTSWFLAQGGRGSPLEAPFSVFNKFKLPRLHKTFCTHRDSLPLELKSACCFIFSKKTRHDL